MFEKFTAIIDSVAHSQRSQAIELFKKLRYTERIAFMAYLLDGIYNRIEDGAPVFSRPDDEHPPVYMLYNSVIKMLLPEIY